MHAHRSLVTAALAGTVLAALAGMTGTAGATPTPHAPPLGIAGTDPAPAASSPQSYALPADATSAGSIVYIKNDNIFLSSPDMSTTVQVTHGGAAQTPDNTGKGFASVSQANSGLIVAVRNQTGPAGEVYGWIWLLDRAGHTLAKFRPQQVTLADSIGCATAPFAEYPEGIAHVSVSPDGSKIAYVQRVGFVNFDCSAAQNYFSYVANVDGSGAFQVTQNSPTGGVDIDVGQWTRNDRLLLSSTASPKIDETTAMYFLNLPSHTAQYWTGPIDLRDPDWINSYYQEPTLSHGRLASDGFFDDYDTTPGYQALVLWTSSGPPDLPVGRCSVPVQAPGTAASVSWPDWSPDGSSLVFTESDGTSDETGEGIYLMGVGNLNRCGSLHAPHLMVPGGSSPDWGPAWPHQPYFTDIGSDYVFYGDVMWLGESGITGGYPDGSYRPGNPVTRGQMAAYLYRYQHDGADAGRCTGRPRFPDVRAASVFCGDITWLETTGITGGYPDGTYRPGNPVTRGQMAAYLHRMAAA